MADLNILPECYIDTTLIETILPPSKRGYNHQHSCNNVAKKMKEELQDHFAIGIVDNDKRLVLYAEECQEITFTNSLSLRKHPDKHHYFIVVDPAMDQFILNCAQAENIDLQQFGFSGQLKPFLKRTKTIKTKKDVALINLVKAIRQHTEVRILRNWIKYINENSYQTDPVELVNITSRG